MSEPVITAVSPRWEARLAAALDRNSRIHLVRRCADLTELLGVADAGVGRIAAVSSDLRGLDRSAVLTLLDQGITPLGIVPVGDPEGERILRRLGITVRIRADADDAEIETAIAQILDPQGEPDDPGAADEQADPGARAEGPRLHVLPDPGSDPTVDPTVPAAGPGVGPDPRPPDPPSWSPQSAPTSSPQSETAPAHTSRSPGRAVTVWGTAGAPGRTVTAVNLAAELAGMVGDNAGAAGRVPVVLVDADTHAASVAQTLALLDEAPGVAAAARLADQGRLTPESFLSVAPEVLPGLRVLTGLPRGDRWPELGDHALADVIAMAAEVADWVVIDTAAPTEQDEDITFDTRAPRRNGATLTAIDRADEVLIVGAADPVGLQRLIRAVEHTVEFDASQLRVIVTKVRAAAVGSDPVTRIRTALDRFAGIEAAAMIPDDRAGLDAALLAGRVLRETRPTSRARQALRQLAIDLVDSTRPGTPQEDEMGTGGGPASGRRGSGSRRSGSRRSGR